MRTPVEESFVIEHCAGPGGMSEGLRLAGIDSTLGIDVDKDACDTAEKMGHPRLHASVRDLDPFTVARQYGWPTGFHASPPCPGFAVSGKGVGRKDTDAILAAIEAIDYGEPPERALAQLRRVMQHPLSDLCIDPLRWILALQPEWITLEQVPAVLPMWQAIARLLARRGYSVWTGYLTAEQFGVPQTRKRAILLATRVGTATAPRPTNSAYRKSLALDPGLPSWVSMADALGWGMTHRPYVTVAAGTAAGGADPQMLGGSGARATVRTEREEGRWIEKAMGFPRRWDGKAGGRLIINDEEYRGRDVRMHYEPAFSITEKARSWQIYEIVREQGVAVARDAVRVSVQDAAVLQSFPADYAWQGSRTSQFQQIGNAVPPLLGEVMARQVMGLT